MVKHSLIAIATLGLITVSASAYDTKACAGCHGANFEKKALNVSKIVKDLPKDEIVKALKGYKAGTFGGAMKGVMQGQVKALSDKDIEDIATQIAGGDKKAEASTTKAESNSTKAEDNATKAESNSTKAEDNATKAESNSTKAEDNATKAESNSTKAETNATAK